MVPVSREDSSIAATVLQPREFVKRMGLRYNLSRLPRVAWTEGLAQIKPLFFKSLRWFGCLGRGGISFISRREIERPAGEAAC
jgi:hypothetical protein